MASAFTTSPLKRSARSTPSLVFPTPVDPMTKTTPGRLQSCLLAAAAIADAIRELPAQNTRRSDAPGSRRLQTITVDAHFPSCARRCATVYLGEHTHACTAQHTLRVPFREIAETVSYMAAVSPAFCAHMTTSTSPICLVNAFALRMYSGRHRG